MMKLIHSHIYYCLPPFLPRIPPAAYRSAPLHTVPNASAKGPSSGTTQPGGGFLFYRYPLHQLDRLHQAQHLAPLGVSWATLGTAGHRCAAGQQGREPVQGLCRWHGVASVAVSVTSYNRYNRSSSSSSAASATSSTDSTRRSTLRRWA
jgi:hypothetical protein